MNVLYTIPHHRRISHPVSFATINNNHDPCILTNKPNTPVKRIYALFVILLMICIVSASACGPFSCAWGNRTYFYTGVLLGITAFALPLFQKRWTSPKRIGFAFLFLLTMLMVWVAGFVLFDFRIMCRMF